MCNFCKVQAICNGYRCSVSFWMTEKYTICVKEILVIVFMWMIITYFWEVTVLKGQACSKWPKQTYQIFHNFEWSRLLRGGCAWHFFLLFWVCFLGNYIALLLFKVLNYSSFEKKNMPGFYSNFGMFCSFLFCFYISFSCCWWEWDYFFYKPVDRKSVV